MISGRPFDGTDDSQQDDTAISVTARFGGDYAPPPTLNGDQETAEDRGPCLRFAAGKCRRGSRCRFFHDQSLRAAPFIPMSRSVTSAGGEEGAAKAIAEKGQEFEGVDAKSSSWRSIDWMLRGESIKIQPYLKAFAEAPWLPELLDRRGCTSLFNKRGKNLRKEVTEAFGMVNAARRALAKVGTAQNNDGVVVIDACCGKGFGSLVLAQMMPDSIVHAVDSNTHMDLSHFREQMNIRFHEVDLFSAKAVELTTSAAAEARTRGSPVLFVGTHLCGALSPRVIELFLGVVGPAALVLAPCCLDRKMPGAKLAAKRLRISPQSYWCQSLLQSIPLGETRRRELLIDDDVLSEQNTFILAAKSE